MKVPIVLRAVALLLLLLAGTVRGQSGLYLFTVDQDALAGAPDFSALNKPLTAADALVVRDGHFYREIGGDPVRLFGVNLAFSASFPEASDSARIAPASAQARDQPGPVGCHGRRTKPRAWRRPPDHDWTLSIARRQFRRPAAHLSGRAQRGGHLCRLPRSHELHLSPDGRRRAPRYPRGDVPQGQQAPPYLPAPYGRTSGAVCSRRTGRTAARGRSGSRNGR